MTKDWDNPRPPKSDFNHATADDLGLPEAWDGSVRGLRKFIGFIDRQMNQLRITPFHPAIAARLAQYMTETDRLSHYLDGFVEGRPEDK